ncbi:MULTISPECIES: PP2C family protein-serine/threonine phosphatase [Brachybacterium]|uniref:Serine/threonine protein phosphatase PstP n=2 Tax=Brachybacterium TaxID=43668 RepID=A0A3R8SPQ9_9MICO|nr:MULTISPECIES: PP2C family serine/threonine-protein phosphatase [Brachybacterium]MDV3295198.1 protein phosphatase 2C domain-containing protein [Brachybacterium paraconglomeratum]RRR18522.1 serine/threonine-protein phosphatase [Brachybacterium paraconglomeratum]TDP80147.1 protein phosphatase [Brachybacterium sp. AG952]GLI30172.1 serine/threonine protein phosphatase [Brachybacterium conglomeratum]GLK04710.1 serine/threonine protein phosphatase [Brachybacterium conglomeratum]
MSIALRYAARSDVGLVRSNNQDSAYAGSHLLVVADGMGGHAGGDVASSVAIGRLAALDSETPASDIVATLEESVLEANQEILRRARDEPQLRGLGTTITALLRAEGKFALAHIGDSRAYLLRDEETVQITKDHTFVQRLLDEGRLTEDEAERHPQRSVLMRVLGDVDADPELDLSLRAAHVGDRWLLCSDGLSGLVSLDTIDATLKDIEDPGECADALVQLALKGGGPDNITCIVADVVDLDALPRGVEAPSTTPQIVGSAARNRHRPTTASGPAAKAAALTREEPEIPYEDEDFSEEEPPRRSPWPAVVVLALLVALLGGLLWGGYAWSQRQYYVGTDGTRVVLYQGLAQDLGPVSLSEPLEVTDIEIEDLPEITRQQVESTISASDREGADQIIDRLEQAAAANRPPTAVSPSDGGGASDVGGAEEGAADGMAPLPTAGSPDEGEAT